jgi:hypothetical protein
LNPLDQAPGAPGDPQDTPLHEGRILLNWRDRPTLHHAQGCVLCCTFRIQAGDRLRHPGEDCPACGRRWEGHRPDPCHICRRTAHFRDDDGRPVHKTCHEIHLTTLHRTNHPHPEAA